MKLIEWKVVTGCERITPGCDNCPTYWEAEKNGWDYSPATQPAFLNDPLYNKMPSAYMVASGTQTRVRSINAEGMKRRGFSSSAVASIKRAFKVVYRESQGRLLDHALQDLEKSEADSPEVMQFVKCIRSSKVGIMRGPLEE